MEGNRSGRPSLPVRSSALRRRPSPGAAQLQVGAPAGHLRHRTGLLARGRPGHDAVLAGANAVEDEATVLVAAGHAADLGDRDPRVLDRLAVRVADDAAEALELLHRAPRGVGLVEADRLRPYLGPAREHQARLDLEPHGVVDRRLVAPADRGPEFGLLLLGRPTSVSIARSWLAAASRPAIRSPGSEVCEK